MVSDEWKFSMGHVTFDPSKAGLTKEVVFHGVVSQKKYYHNSIKPCVYSPTLYLGFFAMFF